MFKLIIIDDECQSAQEMAEFIDYSEFNFSVAGVFGSAENALEFLENNEVDLVLSDIKMRRMSGTELLKIINEKYPQIKVVLVSAYRNFEYAKEAISYNAFEYITKPVSYAEFTRILTKVLNSLENEQKNEIKITNVEEFGELQEKILDFFKSKIKDDEIEAYFRKYNPDYDINNCRCTILNISINGVAEFLLSKWKHGSDNLMLAIRQIVPVKIENVYFLFLTEKLSDIKIVAVDTKSSLNYDEIIDKFISNVNNEITAILGLDIEVVLLNSAVSLNEIYQKDISLIQYTIDAVMAGIYENEREKSTLLIKRFFEKKGIAEQKEFCIELLNKLREKNFLNEDLEIDSIQIRCTNNPLLLMEYCIVLINNGFGIADMKSESLLKAILYINKNISKDVSLSIIAKHLKFNLSYFSHYFKKEMGESYSDYVLKVRMEKAKDMFRNNPQIKINTIVSLLGYKSQPYFYKAFHDYTGLSPNDFKNKR